MGFGFNRVFSDLFLFPGIARSEVGIEIHGARVFCIWECIGRSFVMFMYIVYIGYVKSVL